jgi:Amidohydrolase family
VLHEESQRLTRLEALRLYTYGSAWFSNEDEQKGILAVGRYADLAVLTDDYFAIEDDSIRGLESVLTLVGGRIVFAAEEFSPLGPPLPPVSPDWSPVGRFGGYVNSQSSPPQYQHTPIMSADGRVWEAGCGCGV